MADESTMETLDPDGPAIVVTLSTPIEAQVVRSALEAAGIEAWLANEYLAGVNPPLGQAVGLDVFVRRGDLDIARTVLRELESGAAALPAKPTPCPACGDDSATRKWHPDRGTAVLLYAFGGGATRPGEWRLRCDRCGHEWVPES